MGMAVPRNMNVNTNPIPIRIVETVKRLKKRIERLTIVTGKETETADVTGIEAMNEDAKEAVIEIVNEYLFRIHFGNH